MAIPRNRNRNLRTACDRCYQLKERCDRTSATAPCKRCERLRQACLTERPIRPSGRRRNCRDHSGSETSSTLSIESRITSRPDLDLWLHDTLDLGEEEKELLSLLLGDCPPLQLSVVSPRLKDAEQESFAAPLPNAWPILKDAYLAYAGILKSLPRNYLFEAEDDPHLRRISSAMVTLHDLPINNPEDANTCLALGYALALSIYAAIGTGFPNISRYCLDVTKPFIEAAVANPETLPRIRVLVLFEIMECVVHRRKPSFKIQVPAPGTVDRHLGLCLPMLPHFYDICNISYSIDRGCATTLEIRQELEGIRSQVYSWQPSCPTNFLQESDTIEVVHLLTQARTYRLAALLMIHRLLYPFGKEDGQADIWSREVMMELELARQVSNRPPRFVTIPFIIAAVETRGLVERDKTIQNVDLFVDQFAPAMQKAIRDFLPKVWHGRDADTLHTWFDSVHKPCVALDKIASPSST